MLVSAAMIRFLLIILLCSSVSQAAQLSCDAARSTRLPGRELLKLAEAVCGPFVEDPDAPQDREPIPAAQKLVYEYTADCFKKMNSELRKISKGDLQVISAARQLDAILCDYPVFTGPTYRGANLPAAVLNQYLKQSIVVMDSFSSASESKAIGCKFSGNTIMIMHSKAGRMISHHSKHEDEKEVLFRMGTAFKVLRVSESTQEMMNQVNCFTPTYLIELGEM